MHFSSKIIDKLSKYLPISPAKIKPGLHTHKVASSKLKEVLRELPHQSLEHFIWLSTLHPNGCFDRHTLSVLRSISTQESEETLQQLLSSHLIFKTDTNRYRLHESLRVFSEQLLTSKNSQSYCLPRLGVKWTDAQQKVILEAQKKYESFNVQKDIYFAENILWHIREASWESRIHSVVGSLFPLNHWPEKITELVMTEHAGIDELFSEAKAQAKVYLSQDPGESFVRMSKYALMEGVQRILLETIPEQWVERLLRGNLWSTQQGLNYVLNQSDMERKAQSISLLSPYLIPEYTSILLAEIESFDSDFAKAIATKGIFKILESREKKIVLELIKAIQDESYQALCISAIAQHIPLTLMLQTYFIIEKIEDETEQAKALSAFLKFCTHPLKKQCIALIKNYSDQNLKIRVLNSLTATFPDLRSQIIEIAQQTDLDYITASILWSILEPNHQTTNTILEWLGGEMPALDKVLFFSERISEASDQQRQTLWTFVSCKEAWAKATSTQTSSIDESQWANAVVSCVSTLTENEIEALIQQIGTLSSSSVQGELCLQLLPFIDKQDQLDEIYQLIQSIPELGSKLKILSQAVDYMPHVQEEITAHLPKVNSAITYLEIQVFLLEREPEIAPFFLQSLKKLDDEILKFHFFRQTLDLIPQRNLSSLLDLILALSNFEQRNELLNAIESRLSDQDIIGLMQDLNMVVYPSELLTNTAKQIYRNYWESGTNQSDIALSKTLLSQLPSASNPSSKLTDRDLSEILSISNMTCRSKVLSLYLQEIDWARLPIERLLEIFETLSRGNPQKFIEHFPCIAQGIAQATGIANLQRYGNLCEQLGEISRNQKHVASLRSTAHIFHRFAPPESLPKTA